MSRARFGRWGASLSEDHFAQALAAAGVLGRLSAPETEPSAGEMLAELLGSPVPARWRFPWGRIPQSTGRDAIMLAESWSMAVADLEGRDPRERQLRGAVRLALDLEGAGPAASWVVRSLGRAAVQVDGLSVPAGREAGVRWTWPLQVGFLSDPESMRLMARLRQSRYGESLASVRALQASGDECDLLVLRYSLREAAARLLREVPPVRAGAVAVLGGTIEPWERTETLARTLQEETGAGAVMISAVPSANRADWFTGLMEHLSHNAPLDVAFGRSVGMEPDRILFATASVLEEARLGRAAMRMTTRMAEAPAELHVALSDDMADQVGMAAGSHSAPMVGGALKAQLESFAFDSERGDATVLAEIARAVESAPVHAPGTPRYLQARVLGEDGDTAATRFEAERLHHVEVGIMAPDAGWMQARGAEAFPEDLLPRDEVEHDLLVVFSEPSNLDVPQTATIRLKPTGPSTIARFPFVPRFGSVDARIAVLHQNRVLQTLVLRGRVAAGADPVGEIEFELESVVHPDVAGLGGRSHFHVALVVNRNDDGTRRMLGAAGDRVGVMEMEGMQKAFEAIRNRLSATPPTRTGPAKDPFKPDAVELLTFMAYQGRLLHDALVADHFPVALAAASRIQIVATKAESFLPLEWVYDRASPGAGAKMCPNAREAARTGKCPACPSLDVDTGSAYVCPAGFWALTRVIERHAFDRESRDESGTDFWLSSAAAPGGRQPLQPLKGALYAASNRVDLAKKKKSLSQSVMERLAKAVGLTGGTANHAESWEDWKAKVKSRPSLLVLLSHTASVPNLGTVGLEIADGDCLATGHITRAHVAPEPLPGAPEQGHPIVLLLGCETGAPQIPYQGFVSGFRRAGAAAVLCTNSTVLGREVAPATEQLIGILEEITAEEEPIALGDALLELRRRCVSRGMPMALGIVGYGDADWRLTR